jgi:hypothetical protein
LGAAAARYTDILMVCRLSPGRVTLWYGRVVQRASIPGTIRFNRYTVSIGRRNSDHSCSWAGLCQTSVRRLRGPANLGRCRVYRCNGRKYTVGEQPQYQSAGMSQRASVRNAPRRREAFSGLGLD